MMVMVLGVVFAGHRYSVTGGGTLGRTRGSSQPIEPDVGDAAVVDMRLSDEHEAFRQTVAEFARAVVAPRAKEMVAELGPWLASGQVKWKVHVDDGLEGAVTSLNRLFTGDHDGKLLVRVSEEPA